MNPEWLASLNLVDMHWLCVSGAWIEVDSMAYDAELDVMIVVTGTQTGFVNRRSVDAIMMGSPGLLR